MIYHPCHDEHMNEMLEYEDKLAEINQHFRHTSLNIAWKQTSKTAHKYANIWWQRRMDSRYS